MKLLCIIMKRCQNEAILSLDFHGLPSVAIQGHDVCEAFILLRICISCPGHGWVVVMRPSSNIARHADMQTFATAVRL